jgi:hypothetical protein
MTNVGTCTTVNIKSFLYRWIHYGAVNGELLKLTVQLIPNFVKNVDCRTMK